MVPILQLEKAPVFFDYIRINSSLISDTTFLGEPKIGASNKLFVGKNDEVYAFSVLRFDNFTALPDIIDSLIGANLRLSCASNSPVSNDTNLSVSLLESDAGENWSEENSNINNFSLSGFIQEHLGVLKCEPDDTTMSQLYLELQDAFLSLLTSWRDTLNTNCGIIIQQIDTTMDAIYYLSSRESSSSPYIEVKYIENGDTLKKSIYPTADLSIIDFRENSTTPERLGVNNGKALYSFLKFDLSDTLINKNCVIGKSFLCLKVDTALTRNYDGDFLLYLTVLDSALEWDSIDDIPGFDYAHASEEITNGDTSIVIEIKKVVQGFTSGDRDNFGVVLWAPISTLNISELSIFSSSCFYPEKGPYLELLIMKEE
ncbi:MAG: hypothetical protein KAT41_00490 [Candidatus Marinimicrobia bacterium]|nr:hypothetical protein [Candidatus Neomarinimicrobiota bacterium]